MGYDDLRRLRIRREGDAPPPPGLPGVGAPAFVGKVTSTGSSLARGKFCKVTPVAVLGAEAEGGAGTLTDQSGDVLVYLVGGATPATGDYLVVRRAPHRWVAEKYANVGSGGGTGTIPTCTCTAIPATLTMTSCNESLALDGNYGMYRTGTISYQDPELLPGYTGLNLVVAGGKVFIGDQEWTDPAQANSHFRYYLKCSFSQFNLTRIYREGASFSVNEAGNATREDGTLYSWSIGQPGNACSPFALLRGASFSGSGLTNCVTITSGGSVGPCVRVISGTPTTIC